ncbi:MAG: hypothetical protein O7H40_02790 [Gammaproteobacteria bacterium]|nr:hypothetical protein [Gammaproteobacteria bacterium]
MNNRQSNQSPLTAELETPATRVHPLTVALLAGLLALSAKPGHADPVFPPAHISPDASFATSSPSSFETGEGWYHGSQAARRQTLATAEVHQASPRPSMYYFINIRSYANDESKNLENYRAVDRPTEIKIADQEQIEDSRS